MAQLRFEHSNTAVDASRNQKDEMSEFDKLVEDTPDGGLRAWIVVLGVCCLTVTVFISLS